MCGGNAKYKCGRIDLVHANRDSQFKGTKLVIADSLDVTTKREQLALDPENCKKLLALGDALAFQMRYLEALEFYEKAVSVCPGCFEAHRKTAIRLMSTMQIERAEAEFKWCDKRTDDKLDTQYRLSLCAYYRGDFALAKRIMFDCFPLAKCHDEMYIAVMYWCVLCSVKLHESLDDVLEKFSYDIDAGHHVGYMQTIKLFVNSDLSTINCVDMSDELNLGIYLYGLYHYHLLAGNKDVAKIVFDDVLQLNEYFSSFAYLGAYSETLKNSKSE